MCPNTGLLQLFVVALLLFGAFQIMRIYKSAKINLSTLSTLLTTPQFKHGLISIRLEGFYKGRKTVLKYWLLGGEGTYQVEFYIEPIGDMKRQGFILVSYPKPTEDTFLRDGKVFYAERVFRDKMNAIYSAEEFKDMLEKLVRAVIVVEKDSRK